MPLQNDPQALAEVTTAFEAYETALLANDVPTLQSFFWRSPEAVRFGVTEQLYGHTEIAAFRAARIPTFNSRTQLKRSISTFGDSFASVMYEYISNTNGGASHGRQSQTWVKIDGQWKIVSAHVSLASDSASPITSTIQSLAALGLKPDLETLPTIQGHFETTAALAAKLMQYPLPADIEPASVFTP